MNYANSLTGKRVVQEKIIFFSSSLEKFRENNLAHVN